MRIYLLFFIFIALFLLNGCFKESPIYTLEENFDTIQKNGTEYALHKLSHNGQTFISEPEQFIHPDDYEHYNIGKQIGKTKDGMEIFEVKNEPQRIVMRGLMFPEEFYKLSIHQ